MDVEKTKMRRIYLGDENKLMDVVSQMTTLIPGDAEDVAEKKLKKAAKLKAFYERYPRGPVAQKVYKYPKRLCHENIDDFICTVGLTYKDLLEITAGEDGQRAKIDWPRKIEKSMCSLCDALSDAERTRVYDMVREITPKDILNVMENDRIQVVKIFDIAALREADIGSIAGKIGENTLLHGIYLYCRDRRGYDALPYCMFPTVALLTDESYHFMLGLDDTRCVLAKNGQTEMIMDLFCFLPQAWKERIYTGVKAFSDAKKRGA